MARPINRKSRKGAVGDLTASAAIIDVSDELGAAYVRAINKRGTRDAKRAWKWYKNIGEIHFAISRSARLAGHTRFVVRRLNDDGSIGEAPTDPEVLKAAATLYSPYGGTRGLVSRFYTQRKISGSSHLIRCRDDDGEPDGYDVLSDSELDVSELTEDGKGTLYRRTLNSASSEPSDAFRIEIEAGDYIGRIWEPDAEFVDNSDAALIAIDDLCEQLHILTRGLKSKLKSRLAMAGLLYLPVEIREEAGQPDKDEASVTLDKDPLVDRLMKILIKNMAASGDADVAVPLMVRGPGEQADNVRWITLDREIFAAEISLRQELIGRILTALDSNAEAVKGVGESSNHWSAWAITDEERRVSIAPDVETLAWALTRMVFQPDLIDAGVTDADRYILVPDMSGLATKANLTNDMMEAWDRGLVGDDAYLGTLPIDGETRATDEERVRSAGRQTNNAYLMTYGLPIHDKINWEKVAALGGKPGPGPDSPTGKSTVGPGVGQPGSPGNSESDTKKTKRPAG